MVDTSNNYVNWSRRDPGLYPGVAVDVGVAGLPADAPRYVLARLVRILNNEACLCALYYNNGAWPWLVHSALVAVSSRGPEPPALPHWARRYVDDVIIVDDSA